MLYSILGMLSGSILTPIFDLFKFRNGIDGLHYYGEVHRSKFNSCIHTIGMPFVMYGMNLWIPALLMMNYINAMKMQQYFYFVYITHYISIDTKAGLITAAVYSIPALYANNLYRITDGENMLSYGLWISTLFLVFQEFVGHYFSCDKQSRWSAIPNAIMYAEYYSIFHLVRPNLLAK